jgi:hypothetical protein
MQLHDLLRSCFEPDQCRIFLVDTLDEQGRDVWDSTDGPWKERAFAVAEDLERRGLADRRLFEALVEQRPKRADDIAAVYKAETGQPFNYVVGAPPSPNAFPWSDYRDAMSSGLISMLRFAAYDAKTRSFHTISTSEVFRVYRSLQPWVAAAFPGTEIEAADLENEADPFDGSLGASNCVAKSIHGLAHHFEQPQRMTEHDVFLDLARFGAGESARRLAPDGATIDRVNRLSRDLGIGRITRHGVLA